MRIIFAITILLTVISISHSKNTIGDNHKTLSLSHTNKPALNLFDHLHNLVEKILVFVRPEKKKTKGHRTSSTRIKCRCGLTSRWSRIINGKVASRNEYPWQVGLRLKGDRIFCGGSIISSKTILTAAHCLESKNYPVSISQLFVVVGEYDVTKRDGEKEYNVHSKTVHPHYNPKNLDYDYAILTLTNDITWNHSIKPVCLPNSQKYSAKYDNMDAVVTGWGTMIPHKHFSQYPDKLMKANVKTKTNDWCSRIFKYEHRDITPRMLCALGDNEDSCRGDSGGPLVVKVGRAQRFYVLAGIVSWGTQLCNTAGYPGVYARVTDQLPWIKGNMKGSICPMPNKQHILI